MPGNSRNTHETAFLSPLPAMLIYLAAVAHLMSCGPALNTATVPSPRPEDWWSRQSGSFNMECRARQPRLVFIGDSITRGWAGAGKQVWKKYWDRYGAANFGIPADRIEHVLWRLEHGNISECAPAAAVLLIGTNNRKFNPPRQIAEGVEVLARRMMAMKPGMKIIILSIPPCGERTNELRDRLREANTLIAHLHDGRTIFYVDIFDGFLLPDGRIPRELMPDFLHPSEKGYEIMAAALLPAVRAALGP